VNLNTMGSEHNKFLEIHVNSMDFIYMGLIHT